MLKVVIIGYGEMLAALIEGTLASKNEVLGVLRYEKTKFSPFLLFFKDIFAPSKDLSYIKSRNLRDINAKSANSKAFRDFLTKNKIDVLLVGSWGEKLEKQTFSLPMYDAINCHPALLPRHRGANPYFWAIYNGDAKTGITFHEINENFDCGDIIFQCATKIEKHLNAYDLKLKCTQIASVAVRDLLKDIENKNIVKCPQGQ